MKKTGLAAVSALALGGCLTVEPPSSFELGLRDKAPAPASRAAVEEAVKAAAAATLLDPYSAQYVFQDPVRSIYADYSDRMFGWFVCGTVNAKNRFGGYVGATTFMAHLSGADVVSVERLAIENADATYYAPVAAACQQIYSSSTERLAPES